MKSNLKYKCRAKIIFLFYFFNIKCKYINQFDPLTAKRVNDEFENLI